MMNYKIRLPEDKAQRPINEEYFFITEDDKENRIFLHDYAEIYSRPGLYEQLALDILGYRSHQFMASFLSEELEKRHIPVDSLNLLELGAGSGLFGREVYQHGIKNLIGIDIIPEAKSAANYGDRKIYQHYFIEDFTQIIPSTKEFLVSQKLNIFVCCSALSDGHIPIDALINGVNLIEVNGWILFNIAKSTYENNTGKIVSFFNKAIEKQQLKLLVKKNHTHRKFCNGDELEYTTLFAEKLSHIS